MASEFKLAPAEKAVSTPPAAPLGAMPELFRCEPYATRLTKPACAARWGTANAPGAKAAGLRYSKCHGCAVGARHAKTTKPIELARVAVVEAHRRLAVVRIGEERAAEATRTTAPTSAPKEDESMGKAPINITWKGQTQSISAWARELKLGESMLFIRYSKGLRPPELFAPSARKGGASAKTDGNGAATPPRPRAATSPRAPVADVRDAARAIAADVGAAGVLRVLGFDVTEIAVPAGVALLVREARA